MKAIRQGDVILIPRKKAIPAEAIKQDKCVLALGEVTGHSHQMPTGAELFKFNDATYLKILEPLATLRHEEHHDIDVPYHEWGYDVVIQREYDDNEEWVQVRD